MALNSNGSSGHSSIAAIVASSQAMIACAQFRRQHLLLLAAADRFEAAADGRDRARRQRHALVHEVVEGVERRLAVARARERAGVVARLLAQAHRVRDEGLEQPHQRAPLLHGAAEIVHGVLARSLRIGDRDARSVDDMTRDRTHRRSDRRPGLQSRFGAHIRFYEGVHDSPMGSRMTV